ncbi:hypothetical protein [Streptomyces cucumeris]|uniref:hypothetical protein n=1 Tax=Streptomyces cucumeris TaxID=2962890 RepID=UPI0020C87E65|nr:hypothetical protein [Streptomyces sp. NEAU-Y11]
MKLIADELRKAADEVNALPRDHECDPGWGDAADRLRDRADVLEGVSENPEAPAGS